LLESTFSTSQATSSLELLTLSKNAFKDMSQPESSYSISLIDFKNLLDYQGQEFFIGQGIKIASSDFVEPTE
jgi:hypothetical protein